MTFWFPFPPIHLQKFSFPVPFQNYNMSIPISMTPSCENGNPATSRSHFHVSLYLVRQFHVLYFQRPKILNCWVLFAQPTLLIVLWYNVVHTFASSLFFSLCVVHKLYNAEMAFLSPFPPHITLHITDRVPPRKVYNIITTPTRLRFVLSRTGKFDSVVSPINPLNLTVGQKCEIWPRFSAASKLVGMLLLSILQLYLLTDSVI